MTSLNESTETNGPTHEVGTPEGDLTTGWEVPGRVYNTGTIRGRDYSRKRKIWTKDRTSMYENML